MTLYGGTWFISSWETVHTWGPANRRNQVGRRCGGNFRRFQPCRPTGLRKTVINVVSRA